MAEAFLIAVTGGTGSGKTTLARALRDRLGDRAALLTEDNYYRPRNQHTPDVTGWAHADVEKVINFDDPGSKEMDLLSAHLVALRAMQPIEQPVYDFATHERVAGRVNRIDPRPFVIVEGLHVLSDAAFARLFNLTVFVDTADDLRIIRRIRRDWIERKREPERVIDQYLRFVRAAHQRFTEPAKYICDVVVADEGAPAYSNLAPDAVATERLLAPVWSRLVSMGVAGA